MAERNFQLPLRWSRRFLLLFLVAASLSSYCPHCALAQTPTADSGSDLQAQVAALIEQLGDDSYHRRNDAKWELERIGLAAFEKLRHAAQANPSAQVARAARYLIDSQNVVWWLESDTPEVRNLLKTYNDPKSDRRESTLQQLSDIGSPDAILALCRLARFESNELRSKSAALYLMQAIAKKLKPLEPQPLSTDVAQLAGSIDLSLGDSQRAASTWLRALIADLDQISVKVSSAEGEHVGGRPDSTSVAAWRTIVDKEMAQLASSQNSSTTGTQLEPEESLRLQLITMRLYRWIGSWVTDRYGREPALELVRTSLELTSQNAEALATTAEWAIDAELPELIPELAERYPELFNREPQLGYYLAEAYLRLADQPAAERSVDAASQALVDQLDRLKKLPNVNLVDVQANLHYKYAVHLAHRGLFAWSEQQYIKAVELESPIRAVVRARLAEFYWVGGEYDKAARTLQPLAEQATANRQTEFPVQADIFSSPADNLANYHFFSGIAALERGEKFEASTHLRRALEVDGALPNPDVVIALKKLGSDEPFDEYFQQAFDRMSNSIRVRVLEAEEQLSRANKRELRADAASWVAQECNQLAWLLSKCQISTAEALRLSLRSLELEPDKAVYLDTLARCYFATGQIEDAVRTQKQAIRAAPHERQMLSQLAEFEAALVPAKE